MNKLELVDFEGYWRAAYGNHGIEIIEITVKDGYLQARKVTGDPHVPGGEISFEVNLRAEGQGRIQIAEKGFKNPEWATGKLTAPYNHNSFIFEWSEIRREFTRIPITCPSELCIGKTDITPYYFKGDTPLYFSK